MLTWTRPKGLKRSIDIANRMGILFPYREFWPGFGTVVLIFGDMRLKLRYGNLILSSGGLLDFFNRALFNFITNLRC